MNRRKFLEALGLTAFVAAAKSLCPRLVTEALAAPQAPEMTALAFKMADPDDKTIIAVKNGRLGDKAIGDYFIKLDPRDPRNPAKKRFGWAFVNIPDSKASDGFFSAKFEFSLEDNGAVAVTQSVKVGQTTYSAETVNASGWGPSVAAALDLARRSTPYGKFNAARLEKSDGVAAFTSDPAKPGLFDCSASIGGQSAKVALRVGSPLFKDGSTLLRFRLPFKAGANFNLTDIVAEAQNRLKFAKGSELPISKQEDLAQDLAILGTMCGIQMLSEYNKILPANEKISGSDLFKTVLNNLTPHPTFNDRLKDAIKEGGVDRLMARIENAIKPAGGKPLSALDEPKEGRKEERPICSRRGFFALFAPKGTSPV